MPDKQDSCPNVLRRAGNLLTSNGHVHPNIKQVIDNSQKSHHKLNFSTSIKLKFNQVRDGALFRSQSKSSGSPDMSRKRSISSSVTKSEPQSLPRLLVDSDISSQVLDTERLSAVSEAPSASSMPVQEEQSSTRDSTSETGMGDVTVPRLLQQGTPMTKVSAKERKRAVFRLDPDIGQIIWESKKHRISTRLYFV